MKKISAANQQATRILLADDQETVRRALRLFLEQQAPYTIAGEAQDARSLVAAVQRSAPDVVLLDWELPGFEAAHLLPLTSGQGVPVRVIAMSSRPEAQAAARSAGVAGCVSKGKPAEALLATLNQVLVAGS